MQFTKLEDAFQRLFGTWAADAVEECQVIVRQRCFDAQSLIATFVLGLLAKPSASDKDLAQTAARLGVPVSPQAIRNRISERFANSLEALFRKVVTCLVGTPQALAPLLQRFTAVTLLDSTTLSLPPGQRDRYPGCGGREIDHGAAALKLQTELDLRSGAIMHLQIEPGKSPDVASSRQFAPCSAGSLRIADLGYFRLDALALISRARAYFLSRVQVDTKLFTNDGSEIDLAWLGQQCVGLLDVPVEMGVHDRIPCRLIAFRVPEEQANRRKQKLRHNSLRKRHREPNAETLRLCEWTLLVTNAPKDLMSASEAIILYRSRWQVELLFKRWKSIGRIHVLDGRTEQETMVRLWSRLIGAVLQHWLVMRSVWLSGPTHSLYQAALLIRDIAVDLIHAVQAPAQLPKILCAFQHLIRHRRRTRRKKPGTFELLNDPSRLDYRLT
jgi:hypothetical protein